MHATPKPDLRLGREHILRRRHDFAAIKARGKRVRAAAISLNWTVDWPSGTLAAFIIPKAVGGAVTRNRIRRRLRELYRHVRAQFPPGSATVWIASRPAATATFAELARDFLRLCVRANLLPSTECVPESARTRWKLGPSDSRFSG